jgi:hypothetical protein
VTARNSAVNSIGVDLDSRSAILERVSRTVILRMPAQKAHVALQSESMAMSAALTLRGCRRRTCLTANTFGIDPPPANPTPLAE